MNMKYGSTLNYIDILQPVFLHGNFLQFLVFKTINFIKMYRKIVFLHYFHNDANLSTRYFSILIQLEISNLFLIKEKEIWSIISQNF